MYCPGDSRSSLILSSNGIAMTVLSSLSLSKYLALAEAAGFFEGFFFHSWYRDRLRISEVLNAETAAFLNLDYDNESIKFTIKHLETEAMTQDTLMY